MIGGKYNGKNSSCQLHLSSDNTSIQPIIQTENLNFLSKRHLTT